MRGVPDGVSAVVWESEVDSVRAHCASRAFEVSGAIFYSLESSDCAGCFDCERKHERRLFL